MTRDIDLVVELQPEDASRLEAMLGREFMLNPDSMREAIRRRGMFNVIHASAVIKVDSIQRGAIDWPYLEGWAERLTVAGLLQEVR